jgi:hypothetical protein
MFGLIAELFRRVGGERQNEKLSFRRDVSGILIGVDIAESGSNRRRAHKSKHFSGIPHGADAKALIAGCYRQPVNQMDATRPVLRAIYRTGTKWATGAC